MFRPGYFDCSISRITQSSKRGSLRRGGVLSYHTIASHRNQVPRRTTESPVRKQPATSCARDNINTRHFQGARGGAVYCIRAENETPLSASTTCHGPIMDATRASPHCILRTRFAFSTLSSVNEETSAIGGNCPTSET